MNICDSGYSAIYYKEGCDGWLLLLKNVLYGNYKSDFQGFLTE